MAAAPLPTFVTVAKALMRSVSKLRIDIGYPAMANFDRDMPDRIFDSFHFGWGVDSADQIGYLLEFCRRVVQAGIERHMPISDDIKSAALAFDTVISDPDSMRLYNADKGFTDEKLSKLREKSDEYLKLVYSSSPANISAYLKYDAGKRRGPAVIGFARVFGAEQGGGGRRRRRARTHKCRRTARRRSSRKLLG